MHVDNLKDFNLKYAGNVITSYQINLTEKQLKEIEKTLQKYIKDPETYSLLGNNCTTVALSALIENNIKVNEKTPAISGSRFPMLTIGNVTNAGGFSPSRLLGVLGSSLNSGVVSEIKRFRIARQ
ncbi:DUF4105 domain-containing protein [Pedobacter gandavensis]|uniref:lipoprotein N-acyltransferase Lnb domain-containing protein n=1 Tax=Pedobacter gandavensis TaxID=2679963 RepID=UPI002930E6C6|nr:DUF4105 domain-containing protein [Pedobacter gandavensis]